MLIGEMYIKGFIRNDLTFSLCGLNCSLCPMKIDNYCPGCGGGAGNQSCAIARCSLEHGGITYCFECSEYPCEKYKDIDVYDSFITHRNQLNDMEKTQNIGIDLYHSQITSKQEILKYLLENFNDGRRKTLFCLAVNLLELNDIGSIIHQLKTDITDGMSTKEKATIAVKHFEDIALQRGIALKLNKMPKKIK